MLNFLMMKISSIHPQLKKMNEQSDLLLHSIEKCVSQGTRHPRYKQNLHEIAFIIDMFSRTRIHLPFKRKFIEMNLFRYRNTIDSNPTMIEVYTAICDQMCNYLSYHPIYSAISSYLYEIIPMIDWTIRVNSIASITRS